MGYIANLYKYPIPNFVKDVKKAGADAVLVVDAPHELKEENILRDNLNKNELSLIKLVAPTTDEKRLKDIIKISSGFLYQVTVTGTTGQKSADETVVKKFIGKIKEISNIPVCTGFGIKTPKQVKQVSKYADAVICGSNIVNKIKEGHERSLSAQKLAKFVAKYVKQLAESTR